MKNEAINIIEGTDLYEIEKSIDKLFDEDDDSVNTYKTSMSHFPLDYSHYKEIQNIVYSLKLSDNLQTILDARPINESDFLERARILGSISESMIKFLKDKNSRQVTKYNTYIGDENLAACLSFFHILYDERKNILNMNVYVRSQDFKNNFDYDNVTFLIIAELIKKISYNVFDKYKYVDDVIINVHIGSLHIKK